MKVDHSFISQYLALPSVSYGQNVSDTMFVVVYISEPPDIVKRYSETEAIHLTKHIQLKQVEVYSELYLAVNLMESVPAGSIKTLFVTSRDMPLCIAPKKKYNIQSHLHI